MAGNKSDGVVVSVHLKGSYQRLSAGDAVINNNDLLDLKPSLPAS